MKFLVFNDPHIYNGILANRYGNCLATQAQKLEFISSLSDDVDAIVCAGDLFHSRRATFGEIGVWFDFLDACKCPVISIPGNHDGGESAIASGPYHFLVNYHPNIHDISHTYIDGISEPYWLDGVRFVGLPYTAHEPDLSEVHCDVLLLHTLILGDLDAEKLVSKVDASVVVVGHNHVSFDAATYPNVNGNPAIFTAPGALFRVSSHEDEIRRSISVDIVDTVMMTVDNREVPKIISPDDAFDLLSLAESRERRVNRESLIHGRVDSTVLTCRDIITYVCSQRMYSDDIRERVIRLVENNG